jgi:hypothetical protein
MTPALAQCLRDVAMNRKASSRMITKALALRFIRCVTLQEHRESGYLYALTREGTSAATAHVGCPCGWWQSSLDVTRQLELEKNLTKHQLSCSECPP